MKKRVIYVLITAFCLTLLAACSKEKGAVKEEETTKKVETTAANEADTTSEASAEVTEATTEESTEAATEEVVDDWTYNFSGIPLVLHFPKDLSSQQSGSLVRVLAADKYYANTIFVPEELGSSYTEDFDLMQYVNDNAQGYIARDAGAVATGMKTGLYDVTTEELSVKGLDVLKYEASFDFTSSNGKDYTGSVYGYVWLHTSDVDKYLAGHPVINVIFGYAPRPDRGAGDLEALVELVDYMMYHIERLD